MTDVLFLAEDVVHGNCEAVGADGATCGDDLKPGPSQRAAETSEVGEHDVGEKGHCVDGVVKIAKRMIGDAHHESCSAVKFGDELGVGWELELESVDCGRGELGHEACFVSSDVNELVVDA